MVSFSACQRARLAAPQKKATISKLAPTGATVGLKQSSARHDVRVFGYPGVADVTERIEFLRGRAANDYWIPDRVWNDNCNI